MKNYDNFNVLEINLEDSPSSQMSVSNQGATYEEAFLGGEQTSDAQGKGRARRKKRKLERIANRREVKTERRKLKGDRQEERIARRKKRKSARQEIRDEQMEARQERRNKRMEMKEARKGKPEDDEEDDIEDPATDTSDDLGDDTGSDSRSDEDTDDTGSDSSSDEDEKGDGYYGDDVDSGQSDAGYDDDSSYNKFPSFEEEDNFDGETSSFVSEVTGKKSIPAPIQQICLKIEWNNEMLDRLSKQKKKMQVDGVDTQRVDNAIDQKFARNQQLEGQLEQFIGADGSKARVVSQAKRQARQERLTKVIPQGILMQMQKRGLTKQQIKEWWQSRGAKKYSSMNGEQGWDGYPDVVYTDQSINPIDYIDPTNEYDADLGGGSGFDPMSFANGEQSGGNNFMRSLIIGLLIGGVTIYVIRKYQLLK